MCLVKAKKSEGILKAATELGFNCLHRPHWFMYVPEYLFNSCNYVGWQSHPCTNISFHYFHARVLNPHVKCAK